MAKQNTRKVNILGLGAGLRKAIGTAVLTVLKTTPLGVVLLGGMVFLNLGALPPVLTAAMNPLAQLILIFGMLLTACFNRNRFFFMSLVMFVTLLGSMAAGGTAQHARYTFYTVSSFLLPLNILLFALQQEKKLFSAWGQRNVIVLLLQSNLLALLLLSGDTMLAAALGGDTVRPGFLPPTALPGLAEGTFAAAGVTVLLQRRRSNWGFKTAVLCVLLSVALGQNYAGNGAALALFYGVAGLSIIVAVIQDYHSKAYLDELTGLPSRRALNEELAKLEGDYVIAMLDVDHFKKFNDTYGHEAGDDVLRFIARIMKKYRHGRCYRYGGEEFTILLLGKDLDEALPCLDELRSSIARSQFTLRNGRRQVQVSASIGAAAPEEESCADSVLQAADNALYRAKEQGRNCVSI